MDSSFISPINIDNIYDYINADMVGKHKINLDVNPKNKKIVKKLTKTVFDKLNMSVNNGTKPALIGINNFNDMVKEKCVEFLLTKPKLVNHAEVIPKKKKRYSVKKKYGIKNNTDAGFGPANYPNNEVSYHQYVDDASQFEKLVKESNKQINDSFKAYSEKDAIFNSHDSINNLVSHGSDFISSRCAIKDDIKEGKVTPGAFDDVFSKTIANQITSKNKHQSGKNTILDNNLNNHLDPSTSKSIDTSHNTDNKDNTHIIEGSSSSSDSTYSNYENLNIHDLISNITINQKDHSSNQVEDYEGELYLPNLIREVGEEAPVQPLLYQNTGKGTERIGIKCLTLDSGDNSLRKLIDEGSPKAVVNLGTNRWSKIRVNIQETFKIDKLSDVFLKSFTLIGATINTNCLYFCIGIEELSISKPSNNKFMKDKIVVRNTNTSNGTKDIVSHNYDSQSNFITAVNPNTFIEFNIELTNENGQTAENGTDKTFKSVTESTNRFIIELEFVPRPKKNDIIFDRTPYGSALNAKLSNT